MEEKGQKRKWEREFQIEIKKEGRGASEKKKKKNREIKEVWKKKVRRESRRESFKQI